jgi:hypothetical protein
MQEVKYSNWKMHTLQKSNRGNISNEVWKTIDLVFLMSYKLNSKDNSF